MAMIRSDDESPALFLAHLPISSITTTRCISSEIHLQKDKDKDKERDISPFNEPTLLVASHQIFICKEKDKTDFSHWLSL